MAMIDPKSDHIQVTAHRFGHPATGYPMHRRAMHALIFAEGMELGTALSYRD